MVSIIFTIDNIKFISRTSVRYIQREKHYGLTYAHMDMAAIVRQNNNQVS